MSDKDGFGWKKYFEGIFNPIQTAKVTAHYIHLAIIIIIIFLCAKAGVMLKEWIFPHEALKPAIETISGGTVDASNNKKVKNSILGIF